MSASPLLNRLSDKIRQAAAEIHNLKKEKERLEAELALMNEESRRARRLLREHEEFRQEREKLKGRVAGLLEKFDSLRLS